MAKYHLPPGGGCQLSGVLIEIGDANLDFINPVPVTMGAKGVVVGLANLSRTEKGLIADMELTDLPDKSLTPAVGIRPIKKVYDSVTGKIICTEGRICSVVLNKVPNVDPAIRSLHDQLTD